MNLINALTKAKNMHPAPGTLDKDCRVRFLPWIILHSGRGKRNFFLDAKLVGTTYKSHEYIFHRSTASWSQLRTILFLVYL